MLHRSTFASSATTAFTLALAIGGLLISQDAGGVVDAHSWLDCSNTLPNGQCVGYPIGYPTRANPDINTLYTYLITARAPTASVCQPGRQTIFPGNNPPNLPPASVSAGQTLHLTWEPNGHLDNVQSPAQFRTKVEIYWTGVPNKLIGTRAELQQNPSLLLTSMDFATPQNCDDPANANTVCHGYVTVPQGTAPGKYQMVWFWPFNKNPVGEEYSTCFEVDVTTPGATAEAPTLDAVDKLNGLQTNFAVLEAVRTSGGSINKNSLPEVIAFVERAGYKPEDFDEMNLIHVTGTKGKGSTCALSESILRNYDGPKKIKTGLYTSPHLMEVRERIRINGAPISQELFAKYFFDVWDRLDSTGDKSKPGYFRFLTVVAFHAFKQEKVDVAILEVGVGGAFDSTNIIHKPVVCAVAALGIDHVSVLGSTLGEIAWNKGGIFKKDVPAVTSQQPEEGLSVLLSRAKELGASSIEVTAPFTTEGLGDVTIGLAGKHQVANAALATAICRIWIEKVLGQKITAPEGVVPKEFAKGLASARWAGRGQIMVRDNKPKITWFFDGAHTAESIRVCATWFQDASQKNTQGKTVKRVLVFNCTGPRDGDTLLKPLAQIQSSVQFNEAVFTPAITFASNTYKGDLVNNTAPIDLELKSQKTLAGCWTKQVGLTGNVETEAEVKTTVLPSIEHSINWIDDYVKNEVEKGVDEVQVLVTGSLHLVGGVQSVLGCEVA
ncbi:Folylpolyglutamate synthetase [Dissophora globulifera]|uniref:tetrahydrofolate synthase n=1 Tax=Dissophora globulifera TaxID=979702 RepID=A0A9P6RTX5_9FUNG|nr:Folylpolyglutamate synthetase [Dissophora globulifera]